MGTIRVDAARVLGSIVPDRDVGTSIDALADDAVEKVYTEGILGESLSAGWGPISYRQNTELRIAAWHWNPRGIYSDEATRSGYFTGSSELGEPIRHSYGLLAPAPGRHAERGHRCGFLPLTDGRLDSYWKSDPYLSPDSPEKLETIRSGWSSIAVRPRE